MVNVMKNLKEEVVNFLQAGEGQTVTVDCTGAIGFVKELNNVCVSVAEEVVILEGIDGEVVTIDLSNLNLVQIADNTATIFVNNLTIDIEIC